MGDLQNVSKWWTARECAEVCAKLKLSNLPQAERGWLMTFDKEGLLASPLSRKRDGTKATEYAFDALPDRFKTAVISHQAVVRQQAEDAQARELVQRKASALATSTLAPRQREVMEARLQILNAINSYQLSRDCGRRQAILSFVDQVEALASRINAAERAGLALSDDERSIYIAFDDLGFETGIGYQVLCAANDRRNGAIKISVRTLYGWFKCYDEGGSAALAPKPTKAVQSPDRAWWWDGFMREYALPSKPTAEQALRNFALKLEDPSKAPTYRQVRTALSKLNEIEKHVKREGMLTLMQRLPYVARSTNNMLPTSVYTADGKTFDAEVAHPVHGKPFKPEVTSVVDVATRKCVGVAISLKENSFAVTEALGKACIGHGIPAIFYTDRGAGYKNHLIDGDVTGLMARLSVTKANSLPQRSQSRGLMERYNALLNDLARELPTYLGRDMDREAAQRIHRITRKDIAAVGTSKHLISWGQFYFRLIDLVDRYNARPHSALPRYRDPETGALRHLSPNQQWQAHVDQGWQPVAVTPEEADDIFRPQEIRKVSRGLIQWNTNAYYHADLEPYHNKKVSIGYDIANGSHVWVRELKGNKVGKLICVADCAGHEQAYFPKSAQDAADERRLKGRISRLEGHIEVARDEARALIDGTANANVIPMDQQPLIIEAELEPVLQPTQVKPAEQSAGPKRMRFSDDYELARFAIEQGLDALQETQRSALKNCLQNSTDRELLRMRGIDLEALQSLFRAAA